MSLATPPHPTSAGVLLQHFLDGRARTRAELVEATGLGRATVAARIDALVAAGLLRAAGATTSTGGRPPSMLAFDPSGGTIVAFDFGARHANIAITDLAATVVASVSLALDIADGPVAALDAACTHARTLLETAGRDASHVVGVGIGVPGPVEHASGRPVNPPIMPGWDRFDIPAHVQRAFPVPVLVDNDVNILALGEHAAGGGRHGDLVFVKVATGIGAGIIAGGVLQRGADGAAGDLGHIRVPYSPSPLRTPEDERDLEAIASGTAIAEALVARGIAATSSDHVVALLRAGDADALEITREAGRVLGEALALVVSLHNPAVIVLGGSIARAGEQLLAGVREVVYRRSIPLATQHLSIVQSQGGALAGARGAAILVRQHVLSPALVDAHLAR
ncbi:ROK family protein [Agrococcus jejuensis]|uniref:ROK family protein n=1 Tax=Agrococcus jejuensis TaxID=399736 RepID=UPI0011A77784|nr:ROK family protein [Agrococcus jejuensis]